MTKKMRVRPYIFSSRRFWTKTILSLHINTLVSFFNGLVNRLGLLVIRRLRDLELGNERHLQFPPRAFAVGLLHSAHPGTEARNFLPAVRHGRRRPRGLRDLGCLFRAFTTQGRAGVFFQATNPPTLLVFFYPMFAKCLKFLKIISWSFAK